MTLTPPPPHRPGIRVSPSGSQTPPQTINGSVTIEAALTIPIFIFFMISVLYIFQIIQIQTETYQELHQRGNHITFEGYQNREHLTDGIIDIKETYRINPLLLWQDFGQLKVVQRYYGYTWIGYDVSKNNDNNETLEEQVYITETGTVYHITMDCTHLKLSITSVTNDTVSSLRNDTGAKYYQCERCPREDNGIIFITSFGTRYHSDVNCSGLKRTVSVFLLSEAVSLGYRGCSRCS